MCRIIKIIGVIFLTIITSPAWLGALVFIGIDSVVKFKPKL